VLYRLRYALLVGLALLLCSQAAAVTDPVLTAPAVGLPSPLLHLAKKSVIDKSCIMMCDEWGENGCKKWVMRCKGDPGYPKSLNLAQ
jgi:hypothetical protein